MASDGWTGTIPLLRGVKQGDGLSPTLFNIGLDALVCLVNTDGIPKDCGEGSISVLGYADDLAIMAPDRDSFQRNLFLVADFCEGAGLRINAGKS